MSFQRAWQTVGNHVVWHAQYFWTVFYCLLIKRCLWYSCFVAGARLWRYPSPIFSWQAQHFKRVHGVAFCCCQAVTKCKRRGRRGTLGTSWKLTEAFHIWFNTKSEETGKRIFLATKCQNLRTFRTKCSAWASYVVCLDHVVLLCGTATRGRWVRFCVCGSFASFCATAWWSFKGKGTATCRPDALHSAFHTVHSSGWWFQPLWKILISWDDYSQYMAK